MDRSRLHLSMVASFGISDELLSKCDELLRFVVVIIITGEAESGYFSMTIIFNTFCSTACLCIEFRSCTGIAKQILLLGLLQCLTDGLYFLFNCWVTARCEIYCVNDKTVALDLADQIPHAFERPQVLS